MIFVVKSDSINKNQYSLTMNKDIFSLNGDLDTDVQPEVKSFFTDSKEDTFQLCLNIFSGINKSTFTITNPSGITGFENYESINFSQKKLDQTTNSLTFEVISKLDLDTDAPYPVVFESIPLDVRKYLLPESYIQSDDPLIVALAEDLVADATLQAEAVDNIVSWVAGNIEYEAGLPVDALSVLVNEAGICAGYSNLTTALLRAAGIPAKYQSGCVSKDVEDFEIGSYYYWVVGPEGGRHAWNAVFYPDVGWVSLDPQATTNFLDTAHIIGGFDQCGSTGTVITRIESIPENDFLFDLLMPETYSVTFSHNAANVPDWDRYPLRVIPSSITLLLPVDDPQTSFTLRIKNFSCKSQRWQIINETTWLSSDLTTGTIEPVIFSVDASGFQVGIYDGEITVLGNTELYENDWSLSQTIPVRLYVLENVFTAWLPMIGKNSH